MTSENLFAAIRLHHSRRIPGRRWLARAAVAAVLAEREAGLSVLLMRRSERMGDPWSGHMAMPGGRAQASDDGLRETARRETLEEVGLALDGDACIGRLSDVVTRRHERPTPMVVTPYAFCCPPDVSLQLGHEGAEVLWVPLAYLANPVNRQRMRWRQFGVNWKLSCYDYHGRRIWGLTLMMLDELVRLYRRSGR